MLKFKSVAPRVGAWIETQGCRGGREAAQSHPEWVRGLKQVKRASLGGLHSRTPSGCVD